MCTANPKQEALIQAKVEEFISGDKLFTSVDVANAIKSDGEWIRNRVVRDWLLENITTNDIFSGYTKTRINVNGGTHQATLYLPTWADADIYDKTDQRVLTPDEVKSIRRNKIGQPNPNVVHDINTILSPEEDEDDGDNGDVISKVLRSKNRLFIPGYMIKAMGWNPGDTVDPTKIKTPNIRPDELTVWHDYRVSIPRSAVPWKTEPVKVTLKGGEILFDKA